MTEQPSAAAEPSPDCSACERLVAFRETLRVKHPEWHNAPVPSFVSTDEAQPRLLVVGLAPGMRGANRTGRPFTGDYAGDLLYATLKKTGFSRGKYDARVDDGVRLLDCEITNAVRCLPPENKPLPVEIKTCRKYLEAKIRNNPNLRAILVLGHIAHTATIATLGARQAAHKFVHGATHHIDSVVVFDSYHCSRYNTNTGRLTEDMFTSVFSSVRDYLNSAK